jgi:pimeloyl-ACP methyl ester carboxylesterase
MPLLIFLAFFAGLFALFAALWRWARRRALAFEDRDVLATTPPGRRITVEGVALHYVEQGRGDALVLVHGLGESTFAWRHNIDELARHFRVVAIDMLGFGYSQRVADAPYSAGAHARRLFALMDALGIASATLVGHSLGGLVAMHAAALDPARVRRLVLIDSATAVEAHRLGRTRYFRIFNPFFYAFAYHNESLRRLTFRGLYHGGRVPPDVVGHYLEMARFRGHEEALARLTAALGREPHPDPRALRVPTLVLWGDDDRLLPPARGRALASTLPDTRFVLIPDAGHMPHEEQPQAVNRAIIDFAQRGVFREEARV